MNKEILDILKDKEKLKEIRKITKKYGVRLTSSVLMSICILLTSSGFYQKGNSKVDTKYLQDLTLISSRIISPNSLFMEIHYPTFSNEKKQVSFEEKVEIILDKYNLTREELDVCSAIACAEANGDGTNYEEAVNVICTAYNRTKSSAWVSNLGDS